MAKQSKSSKTIEFLRVGNPWLVGKNVNRIVPVYVVQNLIAPDLERDSARQHAIKHLAFDADFAAEAGLAACIPSDSKGRETLSETTFGLLAPERRIFRDRARGGAGKEGALFPLVGGLIAATASDDGLGRRLRSLMERSDSDWRERLKELLLPAAANDPATAFAMILLGGTSGSSKSDAEPAKKSRLGNFDRCSVRFVDNLISTQSDGGRVAAIRNLTTGLYLISLLQMVAGIEASNKKKPPRVFVYGGLPPGDSNDPVVRAACQSFQEWVSGSWQATAEAIVERMDKTPTLPRSTVAEKREQQLRQLLTTQMAGRSKQLEDTLDELAFSFKHKTSGAAWTRHLMESKPVSFSKTEYTRRVRSLGANIGFVGPDRGIGNPRLFLDTPVLGVLTKGILGRGKSMDFRGFISRTTEQFGLVLGTGEDESVADEIGLVGSGGLDPDEILFRNQEIFRERLVRVGLARTYSDSHTEVVADV